MCLLSEWAVAVMEFKNNSGGNSNTGDGIADGTLGTLYIQNSTMNNLVNHGDLSYFLKPNISMLCIVLGTSQIFNICLLYFYNSVIFTVLLEVWYTLFFLSLLKIGLEKKAK